MPQSILSIKQKLKGLRNPTQKADLLNELAWKLRYENTKEALEISAQALKLSQKHGYQRGIAYGKLHRAVSGFLLSNEMNLVKDLLDAKEYFESVKEKEPGFPVCLNFLARVYESYGDYEHGLNYAQEALKEARKIKYREGEGDILSNLGLIYNRLSDYEQALESFKKSLAIRKKLNNARAVASSLNLIARTYSLKGEYIKALDYYKKSLALRKKENDTSGLPWSHLGIASLKEKALDPEDAIRHYQESLRLNESLGEKRLEVQCLLGLGRIYSGKGEKEKAYGYLNRALTLAGDIKARPLLYEIHLALGEMYERVREFDKALSHYKLYQKIEKEVLNNESRNRLKNQQIAFATERSKKEAEIYQLRNVKLKKAYKEIEEKNEQITDSIRYASRIQHAVLPQEDQYNDYMPEHFIFFRPKDIVSGDFYWIAKKGNDLIIAVADCTGHGIPGAFMSMLGISFLNDIVGGMEVPETNLILDKLRKQVITSLHQSGKEGEAKDGMDISLSVYNTKTRVLQYSGAYNPLYHIRQGKLTELKADRMPIAIYVNMEMVFSTKNLQIRKGDVIYMFSDGYADQFGGPEGRKFKYKPMKELLIDIHEQPMHKQKMILEKRFEQWKGSLPQIDDVILMGVRFT